MTTRAVASLPASVRRGKRTWTWRSLYCTLSEFFSIRANNILLWRSQSLHIAIIGVVVLVVLFPNVSIPSGLLSLPSGVNNPANNRDYMEDTVLSSRGQRPRLIANANGTYLLQREALPRTIIAEYPQVQPFIYQVQAGDTLSTIAAHFNLSQKTLVWANESLILHEDQLSVGQELVILPLDGAYHTVAEGETLASIAAKYGASLETILTYPGNSIPDPDHLTVGAKLIVPGAFLPEPPKPTPVPRTVRAESSANDGQTKTAQPDSSLQGSGSMVWPLSGIITQGYRSYHQAVDIYQPTGTPVVAADDGTVVLTSWLRYSYGYHVIIDHGDGVQTLYAHLSVIEVEVGQTVSKGQEIGKVGITGRVTGPHLHFEVIEGGVRRNPFNYLP
ncbi:MAG: peptidoglycan DD-metalloendopeptidase family protein [Anaerolineae bacterium]